MKKSLFLGFLTLFLVLCGTLSYAEITDEEIERQKLEAIDQINKTYEPAGRFEAVTTFPSSHPTNAISGTASWGHDDQFNIYIWRDYGQVWIEIEPILGQPFICTSSFVIIQNGIQYDTVKLETFSESSQCGDIYVPSVFRLTQWSHYTNPADLNQLFTLIYDGVRDSYSFSIPDTGSTPAPTPSPEPTPDLSDADNDGVIDIWDNCPNTPANSYVNKNGCPAPTTGGGYTQADIDAARQAGYDEGRQAGIEECQNDPASCGISVGGGCTEAELEAAREEARRQCQANSASCGIFDGDGECPEVPTISENLSIHIPLANYQTLLGTLPLWADFAFVPSPDGDLLWRLTDFGQLP
jgi:hypothetical protein